MWEGYSDLAVLTHVMWVWGQYFPLRADWTLSCALWTCLEMPRMLLAIFSFVVWHSEIFYLEEKLVEVTCKCYFQHEGLQFVILPQLCALKTNFLPLCLFFIFLPLQIPCLDHVSSKPIFLAVFQLLYSLGSFQIMKSFFLSPILYLFCTSKPIFIVSYCDCSCCGHVLLCSSLMCHSAPLSISVYHLIFYLSICSLIVSPLISSFSLVFQIIFISIKKTF